MSQTRRALLCATAAALVSPAFAQTAAWPTRPLKIGIPTAAGGSPDTVARTLGAKLTERLGQPTLAEGITQGVGLRRHQRVAKASRDGQTLTMLTAGFTT